MLRHMVGSISARRFFRCPPCGRFRLNLVADALILLLWKLVAQLVQYILQMLLQGFAIEMLLDGIFPTPVYP